MKRNISEYCVTASASIIDVIACVDRNAIGAAFVTDPTGRLIGTVTDGDIRRAILNGYSLSAQITVCMNPKFTSVLITMGRAEVLDLMRARHIEQIPIVDHDGLLLGIHVLREIIGARERPNWAVIMAGGRGERLRPLTDTIPKPMLCVAGRPILERIVLHLVGYGIREIYLSINYLKEVIQNHFGDGSAFGCHIHYLIEDKPLHTGGALSLLPRNPSHPLVVMNGDLVTQTDISDMFSFHEVGEFDVTIACNEYKHQVPFGCLTLDNGRVRAIREKPTLSQYINAGIYVLSPKVLDLVPHNQSFPMVRLIEHALDLDLRVGAFPVSGWIDVGQHSQLNQAQGLC